MDNGNKTCPVCRTENEEVYRFCKNCGASLDGSQPNGAYSYTPGGSSYGQPYGQSYGQPYGFSAGPGFSQYTPEIEGVKTEKLEAYVGIAKRNYYIPKFISISRTGGKSSWNWAIALLGFLLAIPFAASWFFYRKMNKIGLVICAATVAFTLVFTAANFQADQAMFEEMLTGYKTAGIIGLEEYLNTPVNETISFTNELISALQSLILLAGVILLALFGNYFYMRKAVSDIKAFDSDGTLKSPESYALIGQPKTATAIIIPLLFAFINEAIACIPLIIAIMNVFY